METTGALAPSGSLGLRRISAEGRNLPLTMAKAPVSWKIKNARNRYRGAWKRCMASVFNIPTFTGSLKLRLITADKIIDYGCVGKRLVTTAFVTYAVDALQTDQAFETFNFHGFGTGSNAEAVGDTALHTELTTQYAVDSTRVTGSQTETSATIYKTVATLDPDAAVAITEHGIFRVNTGATTMMDRTLFSVVNVAATGDTLEATYELTIAAGG